MHTFRLYLNIHVYADSFSVYYTYTCWQFQYTPHCTCRSGSLMFVCESYATFCCLDSRISFLRTRLSWARTAFSEFVCRDTNCCRYVEGKLLQILTYARVGLCKIGAGNNTDTGPMGRLHLWKEWNTHTVVDALSTQVLTFPSTFALARVSSGSSFFPSRRNCSG